MIKLENYEVVGWEHAIRGARNPMNSWNRMDSKMCNAVLKTSEIAPGVTTAGYEQCEPYISIGPNDHDLMMRLRNAGADHRKYMRMIVVYVDVTAPVYWWAEMDTYKIATVRNSCSFMHKGVSKPFEITDFSIKDQRVYKILSPLRKKSYELTYPYETDEYKMYTDHNGRTYRVYRNGLVIREAFDYIDSWGTGRKRHFEEDGATIYQDKHGYFMVSLAGRDGGHIPLSNLVATLWCDRPEGATQVDHLNGDKGDNSAENLEWVTQPENIHRGFANGLYDEVGGLHQRYKLWKHLSTIIKPSDKCRFGLDVMAGLTHKELAEKWGITPEQANNVRNSMRNSEYEDLFQHSYMWESIIEELNRYRSLYLETHDEQVFQAIRCLLPQGYLQKSTLMLNYEVLANMYKSRKNHKLDEWREFCKWIETLPYSELITGERKDVEE